MQTPNPQVDPNSPQPSPASPNPAPAHPLAPPETPQRHEPPGVPSPLPEQVPGPGTEPIGIPPGMPPEIPVTPTTPQGAGTRGVRNGVTVESVRGRYADVPHDANDQGDSVCP